jgi:hypothetical protein
LAEADWTSLEKQLWEGTCELFFRVKIPTLSRIPNQPCVQLW